MTNYSKQREVILEVIKTNLIHPTAEQIYDLVNKVDSKISKSTVYRNINSLVESGVIEKINTSTGADKYDYIHEPHYHFVCSKCNSIYDVKGIFDINVISNSIKNQINDNIYIKDICINGICENCKSQIKKF